MLTVAGVCGLWRSRGCVVIKGFEVGGGGLRCTCYIWWIWSMGGFFGMIGDAVDVW